MINMLMLSSKSLHGTMLLSILRSNMQFFDSTPIGRIINRFSKDMSVLDITIPSFFKLFVQFLFSTLINLIVISIITPPFIITLIPVAIIYIYIQVKLSIIRSIILNNISYV